MKKRRERRLQNEKKKEITFEFGTDRIAQCMETTAINPEVASWKKF
jgi:hypothetical protein